ncbi:MAG: anti-sigma F factor [Lachnospiraceae bacterium]|nr:anti-sigma F factor [Lachnospiraceae bacterium]
MYKIKRQEMSIEFGCEPVNESFARVSVAAFAARLNPTIEEVSDIKTAVSEAVTNSIIHGYYNMNDGIIKVKCIIENDRLTISVNDKGNGIADIKKAMEPMYTTRPELDRSGMGFAFMQVFMDEISVESTPGEGTTVTMLKRITKEGILKEDSCTAVGYN